MLYVLRLLVDEPLPLNEGLLRAVDLIVPPGLLNPPFGTDPVDLWGQSRDEWRERRSQLPTGQ